MKKILSFVAVYGTTHLLVDAFCISAVLSLKAMNALDGETFVFLIVLYNLIAFGTQPIFGYICDQNKNSKLIAILGVIITMGSLPFMASPYIVVLFCGIGNALFHVGGGVVSLYTTPNKATAPGLFVAPGAIGVFIATYLAGNMTALVVLGQCLLVCIPAIHFAKIDVYSVCEVEEPLIDRKIVLVIIALLSVICFRSLIGGALAFEWQGTTTMKVAVLGMVVLGKAFGGLLGDRYGFAKTGVGGLLVAAPLLTIGMNNWILGLLGLLLFNLTMPITLTILANAFKKYKGFSFGLTTLALVFGYLINRYFSEYYRHNPVFIVGVVALSAILLYLVIGNRPNPIKVIRRVIRD